MNTKQQIYRFCLEAVNQRLLDCGKNLAMIQESLASETKSSAGDKHETGRAMIQLDREQVGGQLAAIEADKAILSKINIELKTGFVQLGSLVKTSEHSYFIAIGTGKITIEKSAYYSISLHSPIGKMLIGKRVGEKVDFRNKEIDILEID